MNRFFEISDKNGVHKFTDADLPLHIGSTADAHISLNDCNEDICLIGESEGHLFLQPLTTADQGDIQEESTAESFDLFHNNKKIDASVWIKSGDTSQINNQQISYEISGDLVRIQLSTNQKSLQTPTAIKPKPPTAPKPLPRVSVKAKSVKKISAKGKIFAAVFATLLLAVVILLLAKSFTINITPTPDKITVSGFPIAFDMGGSFLALTGKYKITATKDGYINLNETIHIGNGQDNFTFTLSPLPGRISFSTNPETNAHFTVDGANIGTSPLPEIEIPAGEHSLQVSKERYQTISHQINIEGYGKSQSFAFSLRPNWGQITLASVPSGAEIKADGQQTAKKTPATIELLSGEHKITMSMNKYQSAAITISVEAETPLFPPTVQLKPALATLQISSEPPGASVTIDRIFIGKTPLTQKILSHKTHSITINAAGHTTANRSIELQAAQSKSIKVKLQAEYGTVFISRQPAKSELLINGILQPPNKNRFQLLAMPHSLELRAKGYKSQNKQLTPLVGSSQSIDFRLQPLNSGKISKTAALGRNLQLLAPGRFIMGSSRREQGRRSNEINRNIDISRYFYIGAREVTNGEYRQFKKDHNSDGTTAHNLNGDKQPVVNISWQEAVAYLNWLSAQDGLVPFYKEQNGDFIITRPLTNGYRLPFESEWAYAARFAKRPQADKFAWQGSFPPPDNSGNFADESARGLLPVVIKGYNDSFPISAPVASFKANVAGVFDMGGNVSEWCHDFYDPANRAGTEIEQDPTGPSSGTHHVVRGASWRDSAVTELRLSYRGYSRKPQDDLGFRIARYAK